MFTRPRHPRAFTFIELLVVVGIVTILLALLVPGLTIARKSAQTAQCLSNLRQLGMGFKSYVADNDGKDFYFIESGGAYWMALIQPYNSHIDQIRDCPRAADVSQSGWGSANTTWDFYNSRGSYGMNLWCCRNIYFSGELHGPGWMYGFDQPANSVSPPVKQDTDIPLFADCTWVGGWPWETDPPPADLYTGGGFGNPGGHIQRFVTNRHGHTTNVVFLDGHAANLVLEDLWRIKWHATFNYSTVSISNN